MGQEPGIGRQENVKKFICMYKNAPYLCETGSEITRKIFWRNRIKLSHHNLQPALPCLRQMRGLGILALRWFHNDAYKFHETIKDKYLQCR